MTHYRILKDFDFSPEAYQGLVTVAYIGGTVVRSLTREAVAVGRKNRSIQPLTDAEVKALTSPAEEDASIDETVNDYWKICAALDEEAEEAEEAGADE